MCASMIFVDITQNRTKGLEKPLFADFGDDVDEDI